MDPLTVQLIIFGVQQLVKNEPAIAAEIQKLMTKTDATPEEWRAVYALSQKPWDSFAA
jgi:hypothetical protein